jgi:5-methyltetrahydrofolate--homocysteine methyltransferase
MPEHNPYARHYIDACTIIKKECPHIHISGGLSNLSFSFRGLNDLRESMHSVFLYYAIKAGMDMGIVNAGKLPLFDDINEEIRKVLIEVILNES